MASKHRPRGMLPPTPPSSFPTAAVELLPLEPRAPIIVISPPVSQGQHRRIPGTQVSAGSSSREPPAPQLSLATDTQNPSAMDLFPKSRFYPYLYSPRHHSTAGEKCHPIHPPKRYVYHHRYPCVLTTFLILLACLGVLIMCGLGLSCYNQARPGKPTQNRVIEQACYPSSIVVSMLPPVVFIITALSLVALFRERVVLYWIEEESGLAHPGQRSGAETGLKPRKLTILSCWSEDVIVDEKYAEAVADQEGAEEHGRHNQEATAARVLFP